MVASFLGWSLNTPKSKHKTGPMHLVGRSKVEARANARYPPIGHVGVHRAFGSAFHPEGAGPSWQSTANPKARGVAVQGFRPSCRERARRTRQQNLGTKVEPSISSRKKGYLHWFLSWLLEENLLKARAYTLQLPRQAQVVPAHAAQAAHAAHAAHAPPPKNLLSSHGNVTPGARLSLTSLPEGRGSARAFVGILITVEVPKKGPGLHVTRDFATLAQPGTRQRGALQGYHWEAEE